MKDYIKKVLKTFIDDVNIGDLNHLKFTMDQNEIDSYVIEWVDENLKDIIFPSIVPTTLSKTIPLKATPNVKLVIHNNCSVTVEIEGMVD